MPSVGRQAAASRQASARRGLLTCRKIIPLHRGTSEVPDFTAVTNELDSEEARSAVSKDGRWLGLACGRPSRRAQSFEARAPSGARAPQDEVRAPQDEAVYASI